MRVCVRVYETRESGAHLFVHARTHTRLQRLGEARLWTWTHLLERRNNLIQEISRANNGRESADDGLYLMEIL